jgi:hypothetical protein
VVKIVLEKVDDLLVGDIVTPTFFAPNKSPAKSRMFSKPFRLARSSPKTPVIIPEPPQQPPDTGNLSGRIPTSAPDSPAPPTRKSRDVALTLENWKIPTESFLPFLPILPKIYRVKSPIKSLVKNILKSPSSFELNSFS